MRRTQPTILIAAACAGVSAWFSIGSLAVAGPDTTARFGFLPPVWLLPVLVAGFVGAVWMAKPSVSTALPLVFSLVLVLPWVPGPIPAVFLVWVDRIVPAVWLTVIVAMLVAARTGWGKRDQEAFLSAFAEKASRSLFHAARAPFVAAAIAFLVYLFAGWSLSGIRVPGGDEPHYLVIAQSLIRDGDIRIENNHLRGDYREYFNAPLRPHYLRRGANGQIYSIHAPGLPTVVAPAYAIFGYPGVVAFLSLIAAIGSALIWRASFLLTGSTSAAWFGWAAGSLTVPFTFQAFSVYPDGLGATLVLFAALPLLEARVSTSRWLVVGGVLGLLPWLHTRFAVIAAALGFVLCLRLLGSAEGRSRIVPFLVLPVVSALGWFAFFRVVYGTFSPTVPYGGDTQSHPLNILTGLPALFFDQQFGILSNAPVYGFCLAGLISLARHRRRLALELLAVAGAYLLAASAFHMWWGGSSSAARFAVPVLPLLALPGAWLWKGAARSATRAAGVVTLMISLAMTTILVTVDRGRLAYNDRDGISRLAEWMNPVVDLPGGLPSFLRHTPATAASYAAIWVMAMLGAAVGLRMAERKYGKRGLVFATPVSFATAAMVALTMVWALDRVSPFTPEMSQLSLLGEYNTRVVPLGVRFAPMKIGPAPDLLPLITLATPPRHVTAGQFSLVLPGFVPGGLYELRPRGATAASGEVALVIGRNATPVATWDLAADFHDGFAELELPVKVGSLVIAGKALTGGGTLTLRPKRLWEGSARLSGAYARRAQRYGPAVVYFFDDGVFPETPGFWLRGGAESEVAVSPERGNIPLQLIVRNAPVNNRVTIEVDHQARTLELKPGEEMTMAVPIAADRPGALLRLRASTGFRPSEVEPGSTDTRFLGVWIEFR